MAVCACCFDETLILLQVIVVCQLERCKTVPALRLLQDSNLLLTIHQALCCCYASQGISRPSLPF